MASFRLVLASVETHSVVEGIAEERLGVIVPVAQINGQERGRSRRGRIPRPDRSFAGRDG